LEKEAEMRYQSAKELRVALRRLKRDTDSAKPISTSKVATRKEQTNSIAVLPFLNISPESGNEYFSDGLTEELISALTQLKGLHVASRASAFQFKGASQDIRKVGEQLGVETVLDGSVRRVGNRLRITAQLLNVADGYLIWSEKYDREMEDVFAIQDDIARSIVDMLKVKLVEGASKAIVNRHTENLEAYNLYLKGRYFWNKRGESIKRAIEYFRGAIEIDPNYALAYAGLADCYNLLNVYSMLPASETAPLAKEAAKKALAIDDGLAEAHAAMALVALSHDWDWLGLEKEFRKTIELNPNYAVAYEWHAFYLAAMGRLNEAIVDMKRALQLDPLSLSINAVTGWVFYWARRFDDAIEQYQRTIEMDPSFPTAHWLIGQAYEQKAMFDQAIEAHRKAVASFQGFAFPLASLAHAYALAGQKEQAQKLLVELEEISKQKFVSAYLRAVVYAGLGENDRAFEWLEKAWLERCWFLIFLKVEPIFDPLRSDPRFADLVRRVNLFIVIRVR